LFTRNVLVFAAENDIILLCLRRHTTHYLQTLDQTFVQPLKTFWQQTVNNWICSNTVRKTKRLQFSTLSTAAWNQAATVGNRSAGFSVCGIYHYDPQKIHHHGFTTSDDAVGKSSLTSAVEGAVNAKEPETSVNIPATQIRSLLHHQAQILLLHLS